MAPNKKKEAVSAASESNVTETSLAVCKVQDLLPENLVFDELVENFKEMDEINFPRIRFRKGKFFMSDDPEDKGVEEFEGVLLYYGRQNTYWEGTYDPNNVTPPDCFSADGEKGSKERDKEGRFGSCKDCILNKFGSGTGKGKACRNQMKLYVQVMGTAVPATLFLAPTSISNFTSNYIMNRITQKGLNYFKVITKFKAYQKDSRDTYFRVTFDIGGSFKDEEATQIKKLRDFWMEAIKRDREKFDESIMGGDDSASSNRSESKKSEKPSTEKANLKTVASKQSTVAVKEAEEVSSSSDMVDDEDPPF